LITRSAEGDDRLLAKYAGELVAVVDVILVIGSGSLVAAQQASRIIPIVAVDLESDPIATGAARSLNRPGGNVTGIFLDAPEIAGKWIQIIREVLPQIKKVALLFDTHLDQTQLKSGEDTARGIGIETLRLGIDQPSDFRSAFQRAVDAKWTQCSCTRRLFSSIRPGLSPNSVTNSDCRRLACSRSMLGLAV
jgi:putative ABC transport system substrate-binding protein